MKVKMFVTCCFAVGILPFGTALSAGGKDKSVVGSWKAAFASPKAARVAEPMVKLLVGKVRLSIFSDGTWERAIHKTTTWGSWKLKDREFTLTVTGTSPNPLDYKQTLVFKVSPDRQRLVPVANSEYVLVKKSNTPLRFRTSKRTGMSGVSD